MADLTEALTIELPEIMTEEYVAAQKKYFNVLAERLLKFMEDQDKTQAQMLRSNIGVKKVYYILIEEILFVAGKLLNFT